MKSDNKVCVVGAGNWGKNHIRTLNELGVLGGIVDANNERLNQYSDQYPDVSVFTNLTDALSDNSFLGFTVATPAETHFNIGKIIIEAKKHILIEKPLTLNIDDAEQLVKQAEANNINQDDAFLVFKKMVKGDMEDAGDSKFDVDNADLYNYFEKIMKIRGPSLRRILEARRARASSSSSTTGGSHSRTKSGKRKSKRSQRRPPNAVCTRAQKLGIRLTVKRNNKRVYKSEEVLRTQIKNAINRQNRKK